MLPFKKQDTHTFRGPLLQVPVLPRVDQEPPARLRQLLRGPVGEGPEGSVVTGRGAHLAHGHQGPNLDVVVLGVVQLLDHVDALADELKGEKRKTHNSQVKQIFIKATVLYTGI